MITIVDYDAGNLRSVKRACDAMGMDSVLSKDPDAVSRADRLIFPGVGAAKSAVDTLGRTGLGEAIRAVHARGAPVLGICLGAQIILEESEEGDVRCLGLLPGRTRRFRPTDPRLKVPHIGWNDVRVERSHPLLAELQPGDEFYFVHSYYPAPLESERVYATTDYGGPFCCALGKDNLFAVQFHPEKSGPLGLEVLERFARWEGTC
jgi:glutamine amidotransferase